MSETPEDAYKIPNDSKSQGSPQQSIGKRSQSK